MKISREVKTAILVISSILLFIWGYSFLKGKDLFSNYKIFYAIYDDVEGLTPSASVTINGLSVGKVTKISFLDKEGKLLVEMQVHTDFPISKTSSASIYEPGLLGGKQIAILPNYMDQTLAVSGDRLISDVKPGMISGMVDKLNPLQTKVESAVVSADSLLKNFNAILDGQAKADLKRSITDLSITMKEFSQASKGINALIADNHSKIDGTMSNLNVASANFSKLSDSLAKANLGKAVNDMEKTLANVDKIMNDLQQGKGSMGKLLKDDGMYNNLEGASKELKLLLADMKNNPKRYVHFSLFGKKGTPYVETEKDTVK